MGRTVARSLSLTGCLSTQTASKGGKKAAPKKTASTAGKKRSRSKAAEDDEVGAYCHCACGACPDSVVGGRRR
jgi:hypothetical protein